MSRITIGIPAYNEEGSIKRLIRDLLSQIDSGVVEIIVNSSGSTDGTAKEVLEAAKVKGRQSCEVKLIDGKQRLGKAAAMDEILCKSTGDIVVFVDADTKLGKQCINHLAGPLLKGKDVGVVSGNVLPLCSNKRDTWFSFMSEFQRELHHQLCMRLTNQNKPVKVNGTFFAMRKGVVGRLPHDVVSDDEYISCHAQNLGYNIAYVSEAKVYTMDPTNIRDYISKRRRILGGHYLIRNALGYSVPTTRIDLLLPEFGKLALKHWRKVFYVLDMVFLEFVSRLLAFLDAFRSKVSPWYRVDSAKFRSE